MNFKAYLQDSFPKLFSFLAWFYKYTPHYRKKLRIVLEKRSLKERQILSELFCNEFVVLDGPFKGMHYLDRSYGSMMLPKLVGSYENSIQPWFYDVIKNNYSTIIDIGSAEGYYAVGLALKSMKSKIYAYDINNSARKACQELAILNGVGQRVEIRNKCDAQELTCRVDDHTMILCDIEGMEAKLLDPEFIPVLRQCDIIVETHDFIIRNVSSTLASRFKNTHRVETINYRKPDVTKYEILNNLSKSEQDFIIDEFRPKMMCWLRLTPKAT